MREARQRTGNLRTEFAPIDFKTRFPALDGIRALAVTMVFADHYGGGGTHGGLVLRMLNQARLRGGAGVDVFFVLSGFLITGILFDTRQDSHFFKRFFARRSVRIFPIIYLLFAILAVLTPVIGYQWHWQQLSFLVYLGNFVANADPLLYVIPSPRHPMAQASLAHLWSLCVEEQFYLLWPVVVWWVRDRVKLIWISAALCGLTLLLRIWAVHAWTPEMADTWLLRALPFRLDDLLYGALLALLLRGPAADRVQRAMTWVFVAGLAAAVWMWRLPESALLTWGLTVVGIASMGLIGMTLRAGSAAFRLFQWRPARVLGRYSYGFYVWHIVWGRVWLALLVWATARFHSAAVGGVITLPLAFGTTLLVAKLSYDFFEVRFLKWKRNFEYDSELRTHETAFAADGN